MVRYQPRISIEHVVGQLEQLARHGKRACLTEDTSWFPGENVKRLRLLFERIIARGAPATISYIGISMPFVLATTTSMLELAKQAGGSILARAGDSVVLITACVTKEPRKGIDFSYGAIAASTGATGAGDARIVLGSFGTVPVVLRRPAEIVRRNGLSDETIEAAVAATREELGALNNLYTPAAYKRDLANALVRRALRRLREQ